MKKSIRLPLLGSAFLAAAGLVLAHPGHAPVEPPVATYVRSPGTPFELFRDTRMILRGTVNGVSTEMMLDSGAGMTVLDTAFADKLGLKGGESISVRGASGSVPGRIVRGVTLTIGGLRLTKLGVLVIDMAQVSRGIGRDIPVVLGRDAFKAGVVTIDFPGRTIRFADRSGFTPPNGATRLELGSDSHLRTVDLSVAGQPPIPATLDIGNGGTVLLSKSYWSGVSALSGLRSARTEVGGVGGMKPARKVTLPSVEFAGLQLQNVPAVFNEDAQALPITGANLGIEMLKPFVVTIDDKGGAMYLEATGKTHDFRRERAGLRTELAAGQLKVMYVSPDGPAAASGLKPGDAIVSVDGQPIGPNYYATSEWVYGPAGKEVALARADGSTVKLTLRDYY